MGENGTRTTDRPEPTRGRVIDSADGRFSAVAARALPLIRTVTVGPGVPPGPPVDGFDRVADFDLADETVTAGSGFHRSRSARAFAVNCAPDSTN
jgi:hypothetical protein